MLRSEGYNAILISTIVDLHVADIPKLLGYNAILISTIVDSAASPSV